MRSSLLIRRLPWQLWLGALLMVVAFAAQAQRGGQPFTVIDPPQTTDAPGKVEVLEFFQYGCPHCRAMEPLVADWKESLSDDVVLRRVPVAFNASMSAWQYLYYSLEAMNRLDLQPAVFRAVQTERDPLNTKDLVLDWAERHGLDRYEFERLYQSFGVAAKVKRAEQLIRAYEIQSVPTFAVGGRYMTSPALANGYQQSIDVVDTLIERVSRGG